MLIKLIAFLFLLVKFNWQDGDDGQVKWARDCDFTGHDVANEPSTYEECGAHCLANKDCIHFTWASSDSTCWIKKADKPAAFPLKGSVCGWVVHRLNFNWHDGDGGQVGLLAATSLAMTLVKLRAPM